MRIANDLEYLTASVNEGRATPLEIVSYLKSRLDNNNDHLPPPRLFIDTPPATVTAKPQTDSKPQTKAEALKATTDAASGQQTPTATVSPLLVGGIALGLFGLYFLGK